MTLFVKLVQYNQNNEAVYAEPTFACTNASQIHEQMAEAFQHLHHSYQNFERDGSGWSIDKILKLEVNSIEYIPLEGSGYMKFKRKMPYQIFKPMAKMFHLVHFGVFAPSGRQLVNHYPSDSSGLKAQLSQLKRKLPSDCKKTMKVSRRENKKIIRDGCVKSFSSLKYLNKHKQTHAFNKQPIKEC